MDEDGDQGNPMQIRPYAATDEASLVACWNATVWADPIDVRTWRSHFLLDPQFEPATCLVAVMDGDVVGFCFGLRQPGTLDAAIVALGVNGEVRRTGIATRLVEQVLEVWRSEGIQRVRVGPYVPTYVAPGVDEIAYPEATAFFLRQRFVVESQPISMRAILSGYRSLPELVAVTTSLETAGIVVRPATGTDILPLRTLLREHFPDWQREVGEVLADLCVGDSGRCTLTVAEQDGRIVGFAQSRGERFGPFGVDPALRGQGVGGVLLNRSLRSMRERGYHVAWFLWTDERAARLYQRFGFEAERRFSLLSIAITEQREGVNPDGF
jgi:GNAT superfamily N-acetyltransferase